MLDFLHAFIHAFLPAETEPSHGNHPLNSRSSPHHPTRIGSKLKAPAGLLVETFVC